MPGRRWRAAKTGRDGRGAAPLRRWRRPRRSGGGGGGASTREAQVTAVLAREAEETAALDSGSGLQLNPLRDEPNKSGERSFHFHYCCDIIPLAFAQRNLEPNST